MDIYAYANRFFYDSHNFDNHFNIALPYFCAKHCGASVNSQMFEQLTQIYSRARHELQDVFCTFYTSNQNVLSFSSQMKGSLSICSLTKSDRVTGTKHENRPNNILAS